MFLCTLFSCFTINFVVHKKSEPGKCSHHLPGSGHRNPYVGGIQMVETTNTTSRVHFQSAGAARRRAFPVEIPQEPRFAVQRLVDDEWRTITFSDGAYDDPYDGRPLLYASRYVAEHIAKAYSGEVRVHEVAQ